MSAYYEYNHRMGYGSDDHMGKEIMEDAISILRDDTSLEIGRHNRVTGPRARRKMEAALKAAMRMNVRNDVRIDIDCLRERYIKHEAVVRRVDGFLVEMEPARGEWQEQVRTAHGWIPR